MKNILFVFMCSIFFYGTAQKEFKTGAIIDSIPVANSTAETFALYLPTAYEKDTLATILFVFSPSGKAKDALEVFKKAAETYNYILVCSNNSRNGPYDPNFAIAERLFNHIFSNFNIKEERIFLAGFSGGSRLASAVASLSGQIAGVIACGAGFSQMPFHLPSEHKFAYAGICGERDMNFREMIDVKAYLDQLAFRNTLFSFGGEHRWPPQEQIAQAFNWLEIESVKRGTLAMSKDEILQSYQEHYKIVKNIDAEKQPLVVQEHYERLVASYKTFFGLDSIVDKMRAHQKSKAYLQVLADRSSAFEKERELAKTFLSRFNKDYDKQGKVNMKWWKKEFQKLDKLASESKGAQFDKMLYRFRFNLYVIIYEKQTLPAYNPTPEQKAFCKQLYVLLYPKNFKNETI